MKQAILALISLFAVGAPAAVAASPTNIGPVTVTVDSRMLRVQVSANTPELNALALQAFNCHGRYAVVQSNGQFNIKFTLVGGSQVRVDILKGGSNTSIHSQTVSGSNDRNALLKAADVAVEKTNMMGLKGFFASKLAYIREMGGKKEVCIGDLFFAGRQITQDGASALSPRWSPDGGKIVYTSFYKSGFPDIFVIDTHSYQRSTLVSFKGTNSGGRYSPNGQQIAMVLSGEGNPEVYVGSAQGRQIRRITRSDAVEASPCFSPDGSKLVYTSDAAGGPQLYVIPAGGGTPARLVTGLSGYCAEPDWSRGDPNKIAFTARMGRGYQIAVYDMSKRSAAQVSKAPYDGIEPSWLADGRHLVYTARTPSESRICILDTETGKTTVISPSNLGAVMQASVLNP